MNKTIRAGLVLAAVIASTGVSAGRPNAVERSFKEYLKSEHTTNVLRGAGIYYEQSIYGVAEGSCSQGVVVPLDFTVVDQPEFSYNSDTPSKGEWIISFKYSGCAGTHVYNAWVVAQPNGDPLVQAMLPGTTQVAVNRQKETAEMLVRQSNSLSKGRSSHSCDTAKVIDTKALSSKKGALAHNEVWTVRRCSETVKVEICVSSIESDVTVGKCEKT